MERRRKWRRKRRRRRRWKGERWLERRGTGKDARNGREAEFVFIEGKARQAGGKGGVGNQTRSEMPTALLLPPQYGVLYIVIHNNRSEIILEEPINYFTCNAAFY